MYKYEEVYNTSLNYFDGDELAAKKWIEKYCLKDRKGNLLEKSPDDMHWRLTKEFVRIEQRYDNSLKESEIHELLKDFKYLIPQGSPMYGIGNNHSLTSLSNCFVIGNNDESDSYGSIMLTDQEQIQLMKRRGGVGHDISHLRPAGSFANNSVLGSNAGSTLYLNRYSESTREVAQDGRRGALMLSISIKHPDAEAFIDSKTNSNKVTGANISVKITDEFMYAVENDLDYFQTFPVDLKWEDHVPFEEELFNGNIVYNKLYDLELSDETYKGCYIKRVRAKSLWDKIIHNAWKFAEPGILFWDKITSESPADCYKEEGFKTISTNPCSEIGLCEYDSCRLLSVNLYSYIKNPFTKQASFDFDLFSDHVRKAQRLMDDLVDLEIEKIDLILNKIKSDPEPDYVKEVEYNLWLKIKEKAVKGRRTGLGVTAEGDMLAALGIKYGSESSINFCNKVHRNLAIEAYISSIVLAKERGSFSIFDFEKEKDNPFINRVLLAANDEYYNPNHPDTSILDSMKKYGRRNISLLTIAPTGTTSLMSRTTSGIEPLFLPYYKRRTKTNSPSKSKFTDEAGDMWEEHFIIHPKFVEWYNINWYKLDSKLFDLDFHKPIDMYDEEGLNNLFKLSPYYGSTANDIDWVASVELQGRIQKWVDHSISKTVNIPKETTKETVSDIYTKAWKSGCKGCTVYRDGSRSGVLVKTEEEKKDSFDYSRSFKRPQITECDIYHKMALGVNWTILVGKVNNNPYEIFVIKQIDNFVFPRKIEKGKIIKVKSKTYSLEGELNGKKYKIDNFIDMMSEDERVNTRKYSAMLRHGMHPKFIVKEIGEYASIVSFDKVVQKVLRHYIEEDEKKESCPSCGSLNYYSTEGCWKCLDCGYSKCG